MPDEDSWEPRTAFELAAVDRFEKARTESSRAACDLIGIYEDRGVPGRALPLIEALLAVVDDAEDRAWLHLTGGQMCEQMRDYDGAVKWYRRGLGLEPTRPEVWYFLNNNLGFCLNGFGQFEEAEPLCRSAIAADPDRHNAHKNLGLSLKGQGRIAEAAECLLQAAERCPEDPRALRHLRDLVAAHPDVVGQVERLAERMSECDGTIAR